MSNVIHLDDISHRSRERVKGLGEVFTPESYVEDMLDLLCKDKRGFWSDEDISFFEPSCGHGNIVIAILKRRLEALHKKSLSSGTKEAPLFAVANAINTLWAIDIDSKNIEQCRTRVFTVVVDFLREKLNLRDELSFIDKNQDFFSHVICAINWQITENETLSSLSNNIDAAENARKTKSGAKWFSQNAHRQINFELSWTNHFEKCESEKSIPIDFERANRFIKSIVNGGAKGFSEFDFAKRTLSADKTVVPTSRRNKDLTAGA